MTDERPVQRHTIIEPAAARPPNPPPTHYGLGVPIGISSGACTIRLQFGYAVTWLEFNPQQAETLGRALLEHAGMAGEGS